MAKGNHGPKTNKAKYNNKKGKWAAPKDGRVTKPLQSAKAQSKDLAKSVATKVKTDKKSKDSKKAKIPSPSASEAESEESEESEDSELSEDEKKPKAAKAVKTNGASHPLEDSESDESDDSESDKDAADSRVNGVKAKAKDDDDDDDDDDSDSEESEAEAKPFQPDSSASEEEHADGSSSSEDSEEEADEKVAEEETAASKKRKAEPESPAQAKKPKAVEAVGNSDSLPSKNLFIGRLSFNVDDEWLKREFDEFGEVTRAVVMTRPDGKSKGFGYVEFQDVEAAQAALEAKHGTEIDGREVNVDYAGAPKQDRPARAERFADKINPPSRNLFIGNLSFDIENNDLAEHFGQFGTITRVSIPTDRDSGQVKGFGYVEFESIEEAQAAFDGSANQYLKGRPMRLDYASTGPKNPGQGGGRGGFGGGYGGGRGGFGGGRGGGFRGGRGGGDRGGFRGGRGGDDRGGFRGGRGGGDRGGFRGGRGGGGGGFSGKRTTFD